MTDSEYFMETKESGIRLLKEGKETVFKMDPSKVYQDPFLDGKVLEGDWDALRFYNLSRVETCREDGVRFREPQNVFTAVTITAEGKAGLDA